jgi:uncharacterized protein with GYD domain
MAMAHYLVQLAYTQEAWAGQLKNPQNRVDIVRPLLEKLGARFEVAYLAFGKYDIVFIMEAPDNVSAAAVGLAIMAGGAVKTYQTTPLMTVDEGIQAMRKGADAASMYRPPA